MHYIPRKEMPQVDEANLPELVALAWQYGQTLASAQPSTVITPMVKFDVVNPHTLHAHQRVNHERALAMPEFVKRKPILVSRDGFVLDGNHRAFVHKQENTPANVIEIGLEFDQALDWLFSLPFTYKLTPATPERN